MVSVVVWVPRAERNLVQRPQECYQINRYLQSGLLQSKRVIKTPSKFQAEGLTVQVICTVGKSKPKLAAYIENCSGVVLEFLRIYIEIDKLILPSGIWSI